MKFSFKKGKVVINNNGVYMAFTLEQLEEMRLLIEEVIKSKQLEQTKA